MCVCVSIIGSSVWNMQVLSWSVKQLDVLFSSGSKIKTLEENLNNICKIVSDVNKYFWYFELLFKGKEIISSIETLNSLWHVFEC